MLFACWMIAGTILGIFLSIIGKNTTIGVVLGFVVAPLLPAVLIWALIDTYVKRSTSAKEK